MAELKDIISYCDRRVRLEDVADFDGSVNGLQFSSKGEIKKIAAAVDAGIEPFKRAIEQEVDLLIVHHGMFWTPHVPITGHTYEKYRLLMEGNMAVYGSHLPLDAHPEIGNNALLAASLDMEVTRWFLEYKGTPIAAIAKAPDSRNTLLARLEALFPKGVTAIEYGSEKPSHVAILTGSGQSAVEHLKAEGVDTLITGELKQHHFNMAQELGLNLYLCGHYATEVFGVRALAQEVAERFDLEYTFIATECPL